MVKVRLHRARKKLKSLLEEAGMGRGDSSSRLKKSAEQFEIGKSNDSFRKVRISEFHFSSQNMAYPFEALSSGGGDRMI